MSKLTKKQWEKRFLVTSICREDLREYYTGEQIACLDDADMEELEERMSEAYMHYFWDDMQIIVDDILSNKDTMSQETTA